MAMGTLKLKIGDKVKTTTFALFKGYTSFEGTVVEIINPDEVKVDMSDTGVFIRIENKYLELTLDNINGINNINGHVSKDKVDPDDWQAQRYQYVNNGGKW